MLVTESGMDTDSKLLQELKALEPILVTESGMVMDSKLLELKALEPIVVTELGMVTDCKLLQELKAPGPMLMIESGMTTDVIPGQPEKYVPMLETESGMMTLEEVAPQGIHSTSPRLSLAEALLRYSPIPKHKGKALLWRLATESGIVMDAML